MNGSILEILERIVEEPVAPLDASTQARIEARVRNAQASASTGVVARRRVMIRAVAAAAAIAAVFAAFVMTRDADDGRRADLVLTSAVGTTVVLPDGTRVEGRAGLTLPDGTILVVATGGRAQIGASVLGEGTTARIVDGIVELVETTPATSEQLGSPPATQPGPTATTPTPSPTTVRTAPPITGSAATQPPSAATTTVPATPRISREGDIDPPTLRARATRVGDRIRIEWQASSDSARLGYAVVAASGDARTTYPPPAGAVVVARTQGETVATIRFRPAIRLRVAALSADDQVLALSRELRPR